VPTSLCALLSPPTFEDEVPAPEADFSPEPDAEPVSLEETDPPPPPPAVEELAGGPLEEDPPVLPVAVGGASEYWTPLESA
jgi:hypothetical protein